MSLHSSSVHSLSWPSDGTTVPQVTQAWASVREAIGPAAAALLPQSPRWVDRSPSPQLLYLEAVTGVWGSIPMPGCVLLPSPLHRARSLPGTRGHTASGCWGEWRGNKQGEAEPCSGSELEIESSGKNKQFQIPQIHKLPPPPPDAQYPPPTLLI